METKNDDALGARAETAPGSTLYSSPEDGLRGAAAIPRADAVISECDQYRYQLSRTWAAGPRVLFIMLNPSTADAQQDDPTIRRCIGFAKSWGFGGLMVGNLFPLRSTDPKELVRRTGWTVAGNDAHLQAMGEQCDLVVCAWGNGQIVDRIIDRFHHYRPLRGLGDLYYLELCNDGTPKHPLYLRKSLQPVRYTAPGIGACVRDRNGEPGAGHPARIRSEEPGGVIAATPKTEQEQGPITNT